MLATRCWATPRSAAADTPDLLLVLWYARRVTGTLPLRISLLSSLLLTGAVAGCHGPDKDDATAGSASVPPASASQTSLAAASAPIASRSHSPWQLERPAYVPPNANPPVGFAPRGQALDFLQRAARYRGKPVDAVRLVAAFDAPTRMLGDETPTLWAAVCAEMGLADEEALEVLCQDNVNWGPSLERADIDQDGVEEFLLFGTWTVAAHNDALLAIFAPYGDSLRRLPIPRGAPFDEMAESPYFYHLGRPMVRKAGKRVLFDVITIERWNAEGVSLGWSPVEEAVRVLETRQTYEFKAGIPKLRETSVEDWTKGKGKRVKVTKAPAE